MSIEKVKDEINRVLYHLPDQTLQDILSLLKTFESKQTLSIVDSAVLNRILSEDKDLLRKLAE
jgi:hypothetical protein